VKLNRSVLRGIALLEALGEAGEPLGPAKLAASVELDKATVSRLLATFEHAGYVDRDPAGGRYRLTNRVLRLSRSLLEHSDLLRIARPHLARLRDDCGESVHLGQFDGDHVVYVDKLEAERSIRLVSTVARSMPIHTTSLGKVMLAAMDPEDVRGVVACLDLTPRTPASISDPGVLLRELDRTAARGFATDEEENEQNVCCVGAPVFDHSGRVVAAVSLAGPTFRVGPRVQDLGERCRRAAVDISDDLAELGVVVTTTPPLGVVSAPGQAGSPAGIVADAASAATSGEPLPARRRALGPVTSDAPPSAPSDAPPSAPTGVPRPGRGGARRPTVAITATPGSTHEDVLDATTDGDIDDPTSPSTAAATPSPRHDRDG
jgi:DNA-binding IclR family transcriptional regulator